MVASSLESARSSAENSTHGLLRSIVQPVARRVPPLSLIGRGKVTVQQPNFVRGRDSQSRFQANAVTEPIGQPATVELMFKAPVLLEAGGLAKLRTASLFIAPTCVCRRPSYSGEPHANGMRAFRHADPDTPRLPSLPRSGSGR